MRDLITIRGGGAGIIIRSLNTGAGTSPAHLVEVDGNDEHRPDRYLLPIGLEAQEDESVVQYGRNEGANNGAAHPPLSPIQTHAADGSGSDGLKIVGGMCGDLGGVEPRNVKHTHDSCEKAHQAVQLNGLSRHVDTCAACSFGVRADGVRAHSEACLREQ